MLLEQHQHAAVKNSKSMKFHLLSLVVNSQQLYEKHRQVTYSDELRVECDS
jgi:hypothetical protein